MTAERTTTRGPYAKTAARRAQILDAARAALAEHGYSAASMRDIAERAGMTHAGLQHHFANKEALLVAVLAERDAHEAARSRDLATNSTASGPAEIMIELLRLNQDSPDLTGLWAELTAAARRADHPAHEYFVTRYAGAREQVRGHLRNRAARGELRAGLDPDSGATVLLAVLDGLQTQWLIDPTIDIQTPLRQFLRLLDPDDT